jgi:hypothetical protein
MGMMKSIIDCVMQQQTSDCLLVPISISYEKVIETGTYIQELLGKSKKPERYGGDGVYFKFFFFFFFFFFFSFFFLLLLHHLHFSLLNYI